MTMTGQVSADTLDDQRRRVAAIVDELERLATEADSLGERYSDTLAQKDAIEAEIEETEVKIFEYQRELAVMQRISSTPPNDLSSRVARLAPSPAFSAEAARSPMR